MSVLIWVQTVCKGYQRTTKVAPSKERINSPISHIMASSQAKGTKSEERSGLSTLGLQR